MFEEDLDIMTIFSSEDGSRRLNHPYQTVAIS
jgi:hypothetical protein